MELFVLFTSLIIILNSVFRQIEPTLLLAGFEAMETRIDHQTDGNIVLPLIVPIPKQRSPYRARIVTPPSSIVLLLVIQQREELVDSSGVSHSNPELWLKKKC